MKTTDLIIQQIVIEMVFYNWYSALKENKLKTWSPDSQKSSVWLREIQKLEMTSFLGHRNEFDNVPLLKELSDDWPVILIKFDLFFLTQGLLKWLTS